MPAPACADRCRRQVTSHEWIVMFTNRTFDILTVMEKNIIKYQHTQVGRLMLYVLLTVALLYWVILVLASFETTVLAIMLIILFIIASFVSLESTVDENYLRIKFGYGIYRKRFPLKAIISAKCVKNHWYYGWGIRYWHWPRMVIFNVSGFDAVEVKMENGKIYRIGTDKPKELESVINREIQLLQQISF